MNSLICLISILLTIFVIGVLCNRFIGDSKTLNEAIIAFMNWIKEELRGCDNKVIDSDCILNVLNNQAFVAEIDKMFNECYNSFYYTTKFENDDNTNSIKIILVYTSPKIPKSKAYLEGNISAYVNKTHGNELITNKHIEVKVSYSKVDDINTCTVLIPYRKQQV